MTRQAKTVREVLIAARWIQERLGWCQKSGYLFDGRYRADRAHSCSPPTHCCAWGAIELVQAKRLLLSAAADEMKEAVRSGDLPEWNDTPGRTKAEVLAAFDRAIKAVGE
jgi:hypothetical protein